MKAALLLLATVASAASADVRPVADKADPRLAVAKAEGDAPIRLAVPITGELTLLLPGGSAITGITIDKPADWQAIPDTASGSIGLRALRPVPNAIMVVSAGDRTWHFVLAASPDTSIPRLVRVIGGKTAHTARVRATATSGQNSWRLSGNRELWPSSIRDDGMKTYLEWPAEQALPAVFALDRLGREEIVNGYMRGTVFTIDRVYPQLVFRIDKAHASARLRSSRKAR